MVATSTHGGAAGPPAPFMPNGSPAPGMPAPPLVSPTGDHAQNAANAAAAAGLMYAGGPVPVSSHSMAIADYAQYAQLAANPGLFDYANLDPSAVGMSYVR